MNKVLIFSLLIILVVASYAMVRISHQEATEPAKEQASSSAVTPSPLTIEQYVTQNISMLSPVKEQLGGTFYITEIEAHGGAGTVKYEDGHNAYIADFTYAVDESGAPKINSFTVRD